MTSSPRHILPLPTDPTAPTPTYWVAESSTGMLHLAYGRNASQTRVVWSASCSTDVRIGARAVYLRHPQQVEVGQRPTGKLCKRCFA